MFDRRDFFKGLLTLPLGLRKPDPVQPLTAYNVQVSFSYDINGKYKKQKPGQPTAFTRYSVLAKDDAEAAEKAYAQVKKEKITDFFCVENISGVTVAEITEDLRGSEDFTFEIKD